MQQTSIQAMTLGCMIGPDRVRVNTTREHRQRDRLIAKLIEDHRFAKKDGATYLRNADELEAIAKKTPGLENIKPFEIEQYAARKGIAVGCFGFYFGGREL